MQEAVESHYNLNHIPDIAKVVSDRPWHHYICSYNYWQQFRCFFGGWGLILYESPTPLYIKQTDLK